jgi:hypothetical protein
LISKFKVDSGRFTRFKEEQHLKTNKQPGFQKATTHIGVREGGFEEIDMEETQMLDDGQKLIFVYLACMMLAEDRDKQFKEEYDQCINEINSDLAKANLKMLELRYSFKTKRERAVTIAMELQYDFEVATCLQGEAIAFYFMYT